MRAFCCVVLFALISACSAESDPPVSAPDEGGLAAATADLPDTDIYLGNLSIDDSGARIENLRAVVAGPGYANQPMFEPGGASFLFVREGAGGKTDIWRYEIASGAVTAVTDSPDRSEFSPKPAPQGGISYIQENPEGDVTRVFRNGAPAIALQPLGYYEWLDAGAQLGVFYRSEPPELHLVEVETGENRTVASAIGRGLQAAPSGGVLFFTSSANGANQLYQAKSDSAAPEPVVEMPGAGEDYRLVFGADGEPSGVFAADGDRLLYRALPDAGDGWAVAYDASDAGAVSRIAVSDDHSLIAVVLQPGE